MNVERQSCIGDPAINIASLAVQAMLYEAACNPSPGLVSSSSGGAHSDMDYFTFLDSTAALISPLLHCAEAGFSPHSPKQIFEQIRQIGQLGECRMFHKTAGVNTHKGALFSLGICCAAGGKALHSGAHFSTLRSIIQEMTAGLVERELRAKVSELELLSAPALTHGERLFLRYKTEGIRGEAERGFPTVFGMSLAFYRENFDLSRNLRLVQTLLAIMRFCEDTTILHRHSLAMLKEVQERAKQVIFLGGVRTSAGMQEIKKMDENFCRRKISPGGSADLLGVTVFLQLLESCWDSLESCRRGKECGGLNIK
ncbi:triphosphoribosyl-dephospho-CoA synthase CitG [Desulfosporosinus sp. PR]|uniref:triphosphoribosyl-dephospho-CoA synthase CitG n=1 Tax=Candidatus Desulfosporosinus nitrosoreducens TaxID=3401928 RepID=UPI0027F100D9|nr:triphosphoribosyl-dephospho-CoA synthase CitG [Desulfosporosinus sp. PR]MDQ7093886.1 triphosphoribosyl-dephospho-CoA synthase CitG [Desulfosporosinus sp. PR]